MDIQPLLISSYHKYFKVSKVDNLRIVDKLIVICAYLDDNRDNGNNRINECRLKFLDDNTDNRNNNNNFSVATVILLSRLYVTSLHLALRPFFPLSLLSLLSLKICIVSVHLDGSPSLELRH